MLIETHRDDKCKKKKKIGHISSHTHTHTHMHLYWEEYHRFISNAVVG